LGIQLAIKRQKQRDGVRHHDRRIRHHSGGGLLGKMRLLSALTRDGADELTDGCPGVRQKLQEVESW
jgi:hypothetical protein